LSRTALTPAQWVRVKELFAELLAQPAGARAARLAATVVEDPAVCAEVADLLAASTDKLAFLDRPVSSLTRPRNLPAIGSRIGPYLLEEEIGRGGMGIVYRAVRADGLYDRRVALKLLHLGGDVGEIGSRFAGEGQILARLQHPEIARFYEAGSDAIGRPYTVMALVEGWPLDAYLRQHAVGVRARLTLFARICGAVDHIHRHLVVHGDLKPANILIEKSGMPKLVDFGIARPLDQGAACAAREAAMTLSYASPERLEGGRIDVAADVFALGVLLYQLVAGRHPFEAYLGNLERLRQAISEEEPVPPGELAGGPEGRAVPKPPDPISSRDLDAIVLTALAREPARRYETVAALARDIRRFLAHRTVSARRASPRERLAALVRRHRAVCVLAAVGLLALTALLVDLDRRGRALAAEQARAIDQLRKADQTADLMADLFTAADPYRGEPEDVTVADLLARAAREAKRLRGSDPERAARYEELLTEIERSVARRPGQ